MRYLTIFFLLALAAPAWGQSTWPASKVVFADSTTLEAKRDEHSFYTESTLPTCGAPTFGLTIYVSDGTTSTDCSVGTPGTVTAQCFCDDDSTWRAGGGGGGGSYTFSADGDTGPAQTISDTDTLLILGEDDTTPGAVRVSTIAEATDTVRVDVIALPAQLLADPVSDVAFAMGDGINFSITNTINDTAQSSFEIHTNLIGSAVAPSGFKIFLDNEGSDVFAKGMVVEVQPTTTNTNTQAGYLVSNLEDLGNVGAAYDVTGTTADKVFAAFDGSDTGVLHALSMGSNSILTSGATIESTELDLLNGLTLIADGAHTTDTSCTLDACTVGTDDTITLEGGTTVTAIADDEVFVGTGSDAGSFTPVLNCVDGTESLDWNGTAFVCNTITGGSASNSFETWATTSGTSPVADSPTDTVTITAGTGITVTGDSGTDTVTIDAAINTADIGDVSVTQTELAELETIGATVVSAGNWTALSNLSGTNTGDQTNITGNAATVTTNANTTGDVTGTGNTTAITAGVIVDADMADDALDPDKVVGDTVNDDVLDVAAGGTGASTLTDGGLLLGAGTGSVTALGVATNGQIPIGDGTTAPQLGNITAEAAGELVVTNGAGSIELDFDPTAVTGVSFGTDIRSDFPAAQTIAATNTITADACGSIKLVTSASNVTTNTTNTFSAPAAGNKGCAMMVCNSGSFTISLDKNPNFIALEAGSVALGSNNCVEVGSTGASGSWYQISEATTVSHMLKSGGTFTGLVVLDGGTALGFPTTFAVADTTPAINGASMFRTSATQSPPTIITNFDQPSTGSVITVYSAGDTTFDCDGPGQFIKCGTTDLVTVSGDMTKWTYQGNFWKLTSYSSQSRNWNVDDDVPEATDFGAAAALDGTDGSLVTGALNDPAMANGMCSGSVSQVAIWTAAGVTQCKDAAETTLATLANGDMMLYQSGTSDWRNFQMSGEGALSAAGAFTITESALQENGASELLGETLGTACTVNQILKSDGAGGLDCAADADSGGAPAFSAVTGGTNTGEEMVVGTGSSLAVSGSGTIAATTAAALAANGTNCSAGSYPLGVDASGVSETCTDATTEIDSAIATHAALGIAGVTLEECFPVYAPTAEIAATDDIQSVWRAPSALTITEVWCETDTGTVTMDIQIDDGTPADVMGADLVCASTAVSDASGLTGGMADGDTLDFAITSVATNPKRLTVCIEYDFD